MKVAYDPADLRRRYIEMAQSSSEIAADFGVAGRTVRGWLARIGLKDAMRMRRQTAASGNTPTNKGVFKPNPKARRRFVTRDGKVVPYARWLMEQHLGRKLRSWEAVHHLDGDSLHDVIENLTILSKSEHHRLHRAEQTRKRRQALR